MQKPAGKVKSFFSHTTNVNRICYIQKLIFIANVFLILHCKKIKTKSL